MTKFNSQGDFVIVLTGVVCGGCEYYCLWSISPFRLDIGGYLIGIAASTMSIEIGGVHIIWWTIGICRQLQALWAGTGES